ncbi:MAG: helix-turn-helix domain-containing protein [Bifidobacteriaceae bacterium]|jgi:transcriptional regulator with XRE-family HTH domain|nr:helix-turn-helix domain-containing protein [Bifidobacteriaceae bacterium]
MIRPVRVVPPSVADLETQLGDALRAARIEAGLSQAELAAHAAVSVSAVRALETARGSSTQTLLRVVRELGLDGWIQAVAPGPAFSPLAAARAAPPRQRVRRPRSGSA